MNIKTAVDEAIAEVVAGAQHAERTAISPIGNVCKVLAHLISPKGSPRSAQANVYDVSGARPRHMKRSEWSTT